MIDDKDQNYINSKSVSELADDLSEKLKKSPKGKKRIIRGGGWFSKAGKCRSANRNDRIPVFGNSSVGFRLSLRKFQTKEKKDKPTAKTMDS